MGPRADAAEANDRHAGRRGGIVLGRSPFEPRIIALGIGTGLALAFAVALVGWVLAEATPIAAEVEAVRGIEVSDERWLRAGATLLSHIGHLLPVAAVALGVAAYARRRWGSWDLGLLLLVVLGGASSVTGTVKLLTTRARPDEAIVETLSSAFPSGHAVRAAAVYGLVLWLALLVTRSTWLRAVLVVVAVAVITLNSLARVALAAHWPSDVLVGVAVGTVWLVITLRLLEPHPVTDEEQAANDAGPGRRHPTG